MRPLSSRAAAVLLIAVLGCAHASESPKPAPSTPAPAPAASSTPSPAPPPVEPPAGVRLDPSEEIAPEELGSIPDPVPGRASVEPIVEAPLAPSSASAGRTAPSPAPTPAGGTSTAPAPTAPAPPATEPSGIWRVQVFASPDRAQADRVGREASARLDAPYVLESERDLVKVRLGSFAREEDAQALKERAVKSGYPGAFRVLVRR